MKTNEVLLLLSGGIDSTTLLAQLKSQELDVHALSFDYGQRHAVELDFAKSNAAFYKVKCFHIIKLDLQVISAMSMLTNRSLAVTNYNDKPLPLKITNTYVPGRNLLLLTHAAAYAEANGISDIYFGANADDGQCYPDCRMDFFDSFNQICLSCSNTANIKVHVPFIAMSKRDVVTKSKLLQVDLQNTLSCYAPIENNACGTCFSCVQRNNSIREAKV